MSGHTPGPWSIWTSNSWRRLGSDATGRLVCEPLKQRDGHPDLHFPNGGEDGPDARLMAAAPEMAELLRTAITFIEEETAILEECHLDPKTGEMDDEDVAAQIEIWREWVGKARKVCG